MVIHRGRIKQSCYTPRCRVALRFSTAQTNSMRRTFPIVLSVGEVAIQSVGTVFSHRRSSEAPSSISICSDCIKPLHLLIHTFNPYYRTGPPFRPLARPDSSVRHFRRPLSRSRLIRPMLTTIGNLPPLRTAYSRVNVDFLCPAGAAPALRNATHSGPRTCSTGRSHSGISPREPLVLPGYSSATFNA